MAEIAGYLQAAKEHRLDYPTALMLIEEVVRRVAMLRRGIAGGSE